MESGTMLAGAMSVSGTSTTTDAPLSAPVTESLVDWLVVVRAPSVELIGHRLLAHGLVVGRAERELFRDDRSLSRRHASFVETSEGLEVTDLGSHNGVRVGGVRVTRKCLVPGDYIEIGRFGFVFARAPEARTLLGDDVLLGDSHVFQLVLSALDGLSSMSSPALIHGPPGSGRTTFCERVHARSARPGPLVWLDSRLTGDLRDTTGPDGAITAAERGTLVLEAIDALSESAKEIIPALVATAERVGCRMLFTANEGDALAGTPFASAWRVELPPLTARRDDLPILTAKLARDHGVTFELSAEEQSCLMTHSFPANVRELSLIVERLSRTPAALRSSIFADLRDAAATGSRMLVSRSGAWFSIGGTRVDLSMSKKLGGVLSTLVRARVEGEGHVSVETLAQLGWPGEKILPRAARNRVYVAVSTLRRMGLRALVGQPGSGYALHGEIDVAD